MQLSRALINLWFCGAGTSPAHESRDGDTAYAPALHL